jgi:hypothetical protein
MSNSIPILFSVTAGFAVTVRQSPVLADPPAAYYRLGQAPGSTIAVDSSANGQNGIYRGVSTWRVLKWDVPFTVEAWVQLIDDYQLNSRVFGQAKADNGDGYGLDLSLPEAGLTGPAFEARGMLGQVARYDYALAPAPVESRYQGEILFETSAFTSLLGLALIAFGLVPRERRGPLEFRGSDAGLSHAGIFPVGAGRLRRRSETELNSFSARYATVVVPVAAPLAGYGLDLRAASRYTRH